MPPYSAASTRVSCGGSERACVSAPVRQLLAPLIRIEPGIGVDYLLDAFFVLVVGGLGTLGGMFGGVGIIGGSQAITSSVAGQTSGYAVVLMLSILFLWLKPNGLFSRR